MNENFRKFRLLLWKNWKLQLRHYCQTIGELLFAVFILAMFRFAHSGHSLNRRESITFESIDMDSAPVVFKNISYCPRTKTTSKIMEKVDVHVPVVGFKDCKYMLQSLHLWSMAAKDSVAGVDFGKGKDSRKMHFTIRSSPIDDNTFKGRSWLTEEKFPKRMPQARDPDLDTPAPGYYQRGFLTLQYKVSKAILEVVVGIPTPPSIRLRRYPIPEYYEDPFIELIATSIALFTIIALVAQVVSVVKFIVVEKERQLKESMKIMGVPNWLHWAAWYVKSLLYLLITIVILICMWTRLLSFSNHRGVLPYSDFTVIFVFIVFYVSASITFCFMLSACFNSATLASTVTVMLFLFTIQPYAMTTNLNRDMPAWARALLSLMPNNALGFGFDIIYKYELAVKGIGWIDIFDDLVDDLRFIYILLLLILDTILYQLAALYIEAVWPGAYGVPKKWHFPFRYFRSKTDIEERVQYDPGSENSLVYELEPDDLEKGVVIKALSKVYGNKVAVRSFALNIYKGQITVLLGHNGAGKTTLICMITGIYPPTSGTAVVNGFDIVEENDMARKSIGICPQHNVLFDELTVADHIYFYARLKGINSSDIKKHVDEFIYLLKLKEKENKRTSTLSGGQKRKLSVAIAFCGDSKVVLLDEPSAGMDPASRRALWAFIESQKSGKTILLTTHFMDEADILSDRIAIMSEGDLKCCGTSFFLKQIYGTGYTLIIEKGPVCYTWKITELLRNYIPHIDLTSDTGTELLYHLDKRFSGKFQDMLKDLEDNTEDYGINSYGISSTTMEDVFMKVGTESQPSAPKVDEALLNTELYELLYGKALIINQIKALFMKRRLCTLRVWRQFVMQLMMAVIYLITTLLSVRDTSFDSTYMEIDFNEYKKPIVVVSHHTHDDVLYGYTTISGWAGAEVKGILMRPMDEFLEKLITDDRLLSNYRYIAAIEFQKPHIIAWFNNAAYHSAPLALNMAINAYIKTAEDPNYQIGVANHPLPWSDAHKEKIKESPIQGNGLTICMTLTFISACCIFFYIKERASKSKHLQIVSGLNIFIFWLVSFIWDFCVNMIILIIFVLIIYLFNTFNTTQDVGIFLVLCLCFQLAILPFIYVCSLCWDSPANGYVRIIFICTLAAMFCVLQQFIIWGRLTLIVDTLKWLAMFLPFYALTSGLFKSGEALSQYNACKQLLETCERGCPPGYLPKHCYVNKKRYYQWTNPGALPEIVMLLLSTILFFVILMLAEFGLCVSPKSIWYRRVKRVKEEEYPEDVDVTQMKVDIDNMTNYQVRHKALYVQDLTKNYGSVRALSGISMVVDFHECFGLLGVNGAGKTTTFSLLTGDQRMTSGRIYIRGMNMTKISDRKRINKITGYCPQDNAVLEELTALETIKMYAMIRGYDPFYSQILAEKLADDLDFRNHLDKKVYTMSGGNKRKLSVAISIIGAPLIIYLDEPTTGIDPASKRRIWNRLSRERQMGRCLILTSHSMEECEALCTRVAIMVRGTFRCIGSTQHLKNRFSQGNIMTIKVQKSKSFEDFNTDINNVLQYVIEEFPSAEYIGRHQQLLTFIIRDRTVPWSEIFRKLEVGMGIYNIENYSLGQSSLELIFLLFAYALQKDDNTDTT